MMSLQHKEWTAGEQLCVPKKKSSRVAFVTTAAVIVSMLAGLVVLSGCMGNPETAELRSANVGDVAKFGDYEWRVLAKEDGKVLIITNEAIGSRSFNDELKDITWEECTLRTYLNDEFFNSFTEAQRGVVVETAVVTPDGRDFNVDGGNDTVDKVFCLSVDEVDQYFSAEEDRIISYDGKERPWWTRSPGSYEDYPGTVNEKGGFTSRRADAEAGVRPAMWVKL